MLKRLFHQHDFPCSKLRSTGISKQCSRPVLDMNCLVAQLGCAENRIWFDFPKKRVDIPLYWNLFIFTPCRLQRQSPPCSIYKKHWYSFWMCRKNHAKTIPLLNRLMVMTCKISTLNDSSSDFYCTNKELMNQFFTVTNLPLIETGMENNWCIFCYIRGIVFWVDGGLCSGWSTFSFTLLFLEIFTWAHFY